MNQFLQQNNQHLQKSTSTSKLHQQTQQQQQQPQLINSQPLFNDIDCILPPSNQLGGLYLGNLKAAQNTNLLKQNNIQAVLTVAKNLKVNYNSSNNIVHQVIPADDLPNFNLSQYFEVGFKFIENQRRHTNVFVHCFAGISRSSSIIIAYLMKKYQYKFKHAFKLVKTKRNLITPNAGFQKQLKQYENQLEYSKLSTTSNEFQKQYRKYENSKESIPNNQFISYHLKSSSGPKHEFTEIPQKYQIPPLQYYQKNQYEQRHHQSFTPQSQKTSQQQLKQQFFPSNQQQQQQQLHYVKRPQVVSAKKKEQNFLNYSFQTMNYNQVWKPIMQQQQSQAINQMQIQNNASNKPNLLIKKPSKKPIFISK